MGEPFAFDDGLDIVDAAAEILFFSLESAPSATEHEGGTPSRRNYTRVVTNLLFHRCVRMYRGICILLRDSIAEEARLLVRSLLDDSSALTFLLETEDAQREGLALGYLKHSIRSDLNVLAKAETAGIDGADWLLPNRATLMALERELSAVKRNTIHKFPGVEARLRRDGYRHMHALYQLLCTSIHPSFRTLTFSLVPEKGFANLEDAVEDVEAWAIVSGQLMLSALISTATIVEWPNQGSVESFVKLANAYLDDRLGKSMEEAGDATEDHAVSDNQIDP
jgi:Family of unknown function (DUF5677)